MLPVLTNSYVRSISSVICRTSNIMTTRQQQTIQSRAEKVEAKPFSEIPEPRKYPLIGTALDYRGFEPKKMVSHQIKRHQQLGPIYKENILPGITETIVYSHSPKDLETILRLTDRTPTRMQVDFYRKIRENLGIDVGIMNHEGEEWHKVRKEVNDHFLNNKSVWSCASEHLEVGLDFADYIKKNLDSNNEVPNFRAEMQKWALEAAGVLVLDCRCGVFSDNVGENVSNVINTASAIMHGLGKLLIKLPVWKLYPTKEYKELRDAIVGQSKAVRAHREEISERYGDKLPRLEASLRQSALSLSAQDAIITDFLGGGVDSTSSAACFILYCIATDPEKQEILRKEVLEFLDRGDITGPSIQNLKYMQACNREAQRLFPLATGYTRKINHDVILSGYEVPKGTLVFMTCNMMNNRKSEYFENPDEFIPERWLTSNRPKARFVLGSSFGHGPRMCPGGKFAMQEINTLLIALLSRFRLEYHHEPFVLETRLFSAPAQEPQFTFIPLE